jgi:hypothetical protein
MAQVSGEVRAMRWSGAAFVLFLSGALILPLQMAGNSPDEVPAKPGWYRAQHASLQSVCPGEIKGYDFHSTCRNVVAAWNSAIADTKLDRLIIWGGGHSDYPGNEIYAFDLNSRRMERLDDPSPINTTEKCVETLSDGKPNARHTYAGLAYMVNVNRMFSFGGSLNQCGFMTNTTWTLDLGALEWKDMKPEGGTPAAAPGAIADYDPNSHLVFLHDTKDFWQYDYEKNRYKRAGTSDGLDYHMNGAIDPKRQLFLFAGAAGAAGGGLKALSFAQGKYSMHDWTRAALPTCGPLLKSIYPGLAYDSKLDRMVGWPNFGDTVYLFDADTKSCTTQTYAGAPPDSLHQGSPKTTNGTFGRFRYFPDKDVFVLVNDATSDAYLLQLASPEKAEAH